MQTLEEHAATQYVLRKHHLLHGSHAQSVLQVVNDIIALHATSAATPYLSLFIRMKNFQRRQLDEEFYEKRNLVRLQAMRGTLFITSTKSAPILFQATRRLEPNILKWLSKWGIKSLEYRELAEKLHHVLKGGGKTLPEIKRSLPSETVKSVERRVGRTVYKGTNVNMVLSAMMWQGMVISEKNAETLRVTEANRYALLEELYPTLNLDSIGEEEARAVLVKWYIKAFGPVAEEDIAWWTGFTKTDTKRALATIGKELLFVKVNGLQGDYLMLEADYKQFIKFKPLRTRSVLLLPYEDPYTKGYKVKDRLVDLNLQKRAYVGGGVQPTILLNGKIIGTWNRSIEERKGPIKLTFFQQTEKDVEREVIQKSRAIAKLMTDREISVPVEVEAE